MTIKRLTRKESIEAMDSWISGGFRLPEVNREYAELRKDLTELFEKASSEQKDGTDGYRMDVCYGVLIYDYFMHRSWFTQRLASDDGFWRYLSLVCVPDLIGKRWSNDNADHYYVKPSRIWLKCIWWYIHLSLKESDLALTKKILLSRNFNTDTILNLVERTGRGGTNIDVYREIMSMYAPLKKVRGKDFRSIMKLNTAKAVVLEPVFCEGGVKGYVESIINELALK